MANMDDDKDSQADPDSGSEPQDTPHKLTGRERRMLNLKPFVPGDVRINRKGRPKSFDQWRDLVQSILEEPALKTDQNGIPLPDGKLTLIQIPKVDKDGLPVVDEDGYPVLVDHYATNAELLARKWLRTKDNQQSLIEAGFGKVPMAVDLNLNNKPGQGMSDEDRLRRLQALAQKVSGLALPEPPLPSENVIEAKAVDVSSEENSNAK
jgi:hypothetical protein